VESLGTRVQLLSFCACAQGTEAGTFAEFSGGSSYARLSLYSKSFWKSQKGRKYEH